MVNFLLVTRNNFPTTDGKRKICLVLETVHLFVGLSSKCELFFSFQGYRGKGARPGAQAAQASSVVSEMNSTPGLIVSTFNITL